MKTILVKRSSKHILKYQTKTKTKWLDQFFSDYRKCLQFYIDLIWDKKLPLKTYLSSKVLPSDIIKFAQWKEVVYKQASEIIRSNIKKKKTSKPKIENISIPVDSRLFNITNHSKEFDEFIRIWTPYFHGRSKEKYQVELIHLPVKQHKQSLKFKDWKRKNTVFLKKIKNNYYLKFIYEKEIPLKASGKDQGYKRLLATSEGQLNWGWF